MPRKLFVTTALPYANAPFHVGHMMEYIQADIWVRFQRMQGHQVHFVCADDAHGAAMMIAADRAGLPPQEFVTRIAAGRQQYLDGFHIAFDHWHSTHSPENVELSQSIYRALRDAGLTYTKSIEQFYDPVKGMFLADRYIKGTCPVCGAKDQYGDNCEVCGSTYAPTELKDPYSVLTGARPELRSSEHFFFRLSDAACVEFLRQWVFEPGRLQPEVVNKAREWLDGKDGAGLADWDISRDAPYFGIPIPDTKDKYFYVWLDAPIGYLASLKAYFDSGKVKAKYPDETRSFDEFLKADDVEQVHFIGKDIIYFHTLFWPAMLHFAGRKVPDQINVHGFITVSGEKMSKSRGTGIDPLKYLKLGMNAEWFRYYVAAKLNGHVEDIDFNPDDFVARVNSDLIGKYVNIASRAASFLARYFDGRTVARIRRREHGGARLGRRHRRELCGARVRQGGARGDAHRRRGQRALRPAEAVGACQVQRRGFAARPARGVLGRDHGVQGPHVLPGTDPAADGGAGPGLARLCRQDCLVRQPPGRRQGSEVRAPDDARRTQATRRAVRTRRRPRSKPHRCRVAPRLPRRSPSTTSPGSTCASPRSSRLATSTVRTSCCA